MLDQLSHNSLKNNKNPYHFNNRYCLRAPLFSLNIIISNIKNQKNDYAFLKTQLKNPLLKEAIFLASPYLYEELNQCFNEEIKDVKKTERLKQTFLKYIIRASTRGTPFGLFAGVIVGCFNTETKIDLNSKFKRQTRLDMNYLVAISNYIENVPVIKSQLLFSTNNSLYKIGNQYRYIEYKLENLKRAYSIESIEYSVYIEEILNKAKTGKTINQLADDIIDDDITREDATKFIYELIDNQILTSELEPSVTGNNILSQIIAVLSRLKNCDVYLNQLIILQKALLKLDANKNNSIEYYKNCYPILEAIGVDYDVKHVFQTDTYTRTKSNILNKRIGYNLRNSLPLLNAINPKKENKNLKQFKKAFIERYETRKIPLAKALDIETGVGYIQNIAISDTVPFLSDVTPTLKKSIITDISLSESDIIIQKLLFNALKNKQLSIELKDAYFKDIDLNWDDLPDTFSALIEIVNLNNEEHIYLNAIGGSNGANLLGRFADGNNELFEYVKEITTMEQKMNPEKVLAEIVHLPEARIGNVLKRPQLRDYELPYLGKSNLPLEKQIDINDILVFIKKDRIVLWSQKLDKEILPCLTNAHNYSYKALPIYHFLCDLQTQNKRKNLGFSWRDLALNQSFLPRVTYKNCILSKATWIIDIIDFKPVLMLKNNENALLIEVNEWRNSNQVPQYVQLKEGDNTLLINLEDIRMIQLLLATVKSKSQFILEEFLFVEDTIVKNNNNERFTNQVVVSFYNEAKLKKVIGNAK